MLDGGHAAWHVLLRSQCTLQLCKLQAASRGRCACCCRRDQQLPGARQAELLLLPRHGRSRLEKEAVAATAGGKPHAHAAAAAAAPAWLLLRHRHRDPEDVSVLVDVGQDEQPRAGGNLYLLRHARRGEWCRCSVAMQEQR